MSTFGGTKLFWNTGDGMFYNKATPDPDLVTDDLGDVRIGDVNGDGRDDIVVFTKTGLSINRHELFDPNDDVMDPGAGAEQIRLLLSNGDGTFRTEILNTSSGAARVDVGRVFSQLGDFNADGRLDIVKHDGTSLFVMTQNDSEPDVITDVTDEGAAMARQSVAYSHSWTDHAEQISAKTCLMPVLCVRRGMPVVRAVVSHEESFTSDPAQGPANTLYYSYDDPVVARLEGFLGFATFRVWDPHQQTETVTKFDAITTHGPYHAFAGTPKTITTVTLISPAGGDTTSAIARVVRTIRTSSTGEPGVFTQLNGGKTFHVFPETTRMETSDTTVSIEWNPSLVGLPAQVHLAFDVNGLKPFGAVQVDQQFDEYGNLKHQETNVVNGTKEIDDYDYDLTTQRITAWLISVPKTRKVTRSEYDSDPPAVTRYTKYIADSLGRQTTVIEEPGTPHQVLTYTNLDQDTGMPLKITTEVAGLPDRVQHKEYATWFANQPDEQIFVSQEWSEHDQPQYEPSSWHVVQPAYGLVVAALDANGVASGVTFDDLGRPLQNNTDGQAVVHHAYAAHTDAKGKMDGLTVTTTTDTGAPGSGKVNSSVAVTDQLGRTRSGTTTGFDGTPLVTTTVYDPQGRVHAVSRPTAVGKNPAGWSYSYYDNLERPTRNDTPDGKQEKFEYPDQFTVVDRPVGLVSILHPINKTELDQDGRVIKSSVGYVEAGVQKWAVTSTEYGPNGISKITDDHGNVTKLDYDVYGRQSTVVDPDRGTVKRTFFASGELQTESHDGTGDVSTYTYDDLGRKTMVTDHTGATNSDVGTTFVWDTAAHGIGQLASATSPDGVTVTNHYDTLGRPVGQDYSFTSSGGIVTTYTTNKNYDGLGRVDLVAYPDVPGRQRLTLKHSYNNYGYETDLSDVTPGQNPPSQNLVHVVSQNEDGATTGASFGPTGSITEAESYDPVTGQLKNISISNTGNVKLQDLTYGYWDNGQVASRTRDDSTGKRVEAFQYDDFNRLTSWALTNGNSPTSSTSYGFDTIGNLLSTANSTNLTPAETRGFPATGQAHPHAMINDLNPNGQGEEIYTYDGQGREKQITDNASKVLRKTEYNAFDLPTSVVRNGSTTTFGYDAFGTRVLERGPDLTTFTIPGMFEDRINGSNRHAYVFYIPGVGQMVFDGKATTTEYVLDDQLHSSSTVIDSGGQVQQLFYYDPYGARINADGTRAASIPGDITHGFTGHEHDDELRLINMNGRMFDPITRQFLSPDPVATNHPYSYTNSSPLNQTDPTGLDPCGAIDYSCVLGNLGNPSPAAGTPGLDPTFAAWQAYNPMPGNDILGTQNLFGAPLTMDDIFIALNGLNTSINKAAQSYDDLMNTEVYKNDTIGTITVEDVKFTVDVALTASLVFDVAAAGYGIYSTYKEVQAVKLAIDTATVARTALEVGESGASGIGAAFEMTEFGSKELAHSAEVYQQFSGPRSMLNVNDVNVFGGTVNCQCTAVAGKAVLEGSPASALNIAPQKGWDYFLNMFGNPTARSGGTTLGDVARKLSAGSLPEGEVGFVSSVSRNGKFSHVFNYRIEAGKPVFYDFQPAPIFVRGNVINDARIGWFGRLNQWLNFGQYSYYRVPPGFPVH